MVQLALFQGLQILTVLICAPLLRGIINRLKAMVQSKRGPSIWQPYHDLWKLLRKGSVVSEHASWVYHAAPLFSFITPLIVAMLIPVLTAYPLPYAFMGDMLAGGFILSLGGFFTSLAAMDTASTFAGRAGGDPRPLQRHVDCPGHHSLRRQSDAHLSRLPVQSGALAAGRCPLHGDFSGNRPHPGR